jgi:nucleotide-binding universal stress UspA family protein
MFNVVLVGADNTPTARRAVEEASEVAAMSKGTLHILTAHGHSPFVESDDRHEFAHVTKGDDGAALLQELAFIAKNHGVDAVTHFVKRDAADALLDMANEIKADLVVVGNRGMRGVQRVLGSVPNSVAHKATCSVLIVDTID